MTSRDLERLRSNGPMVKKPDLLQSYIYESVSLSYGRNATLHFLKTFHVHRKFTDRFLKITEFSLIL